jgi:hypothetical protein
MLRVGTIDVMGKVLKYGIERTANSPFG